MAYWMAALFPIHGFTLFVPYRCCCVVVVVVVRLALAVKKRKNLEVQHYVIRLVDTNNVTLRYVLDRSHGLVIRICHIVWHVVVQC